MAMRRMIGLLPLLLWIGCGGQTPTTPTTATPSTPPTPPPSSSPRLVITGNLSLTAVGETSQLTARATFADGTTKDITNEALWMSRQPSIATVSPTGLVTATGLGRAEVGFPYPNAAVGSVITLVIVS